ncbi:MAG: hypothetical protein HY269_07330, partial [Deltaproteobacteria bacterium]|nr:hypothetical protein [Deltaproteobacteria bacterium]
MRIPSLLARQGDWGSRVILGGGAALLIALAASTALLALLANERPVFAQQAKTYTQKDVADQVAKGWAFAGRCDKANARKQIDRLKKTKEALEAAAKSGVVQGAADDAKLLGDDIANMQEYLGFCRDVRKVTGANGENYYFPRVSDTDTAGKFIDDAQRAVRACDRDFYKAVIKAARDRATEIRLKGIDGKTGRIADNVALTFIQLALDLEAAEEAAFKQCAPPGKTETPKADTGTTGPSKTEPGKTQSGKAEPAKTDAPKTGTGTGQPNQPPEPPKAPSDSPGQGQGMLPGGFAPRLGIFAGAQFDSWKQASIGSFTTGGANTGPFLLSRGAGTGLNFGAFAKFDVPSSSSFSGPSLLGVPGDTMLKFDFTFFSTTNSISGATAPGQSASFVFLQPFAGINNSFLGTADASIKSTRAGFALDALWTFDHAAGTFKAEIVPAGQGGFRFGAGLRYQRTYVGHDARITSASFPGETHRLMLDTFDNNIGPAFQIGFNYQGGPWSFGVQHTSSFNLRFTSATAQQDSVIPGFTPSIFGIKTDKSTTGFAYIGGFDVRAGYDLTPRITLGASGGFLFNSAESYWKVPIVPGEATRLKTSSQLSGNFG